jgi:excisionase family DNA binding protein
MTKLMERNPIAPNETDLNSIEMLNRILNGFADKQSSGFTKIPAKPKLIGPTGEEVELPEVVFKLLQQTISYLAQGKAVKLIPVGMELTTQEAADLLNVSRPHLVKLIDEGKIPCKKVGTHRRIRFQDLMEYKAQQDREQRRLLAELAQFSQDLGLYEDYPNYE